MDRQVIDDGDGRLDLVSVCSDGSSTRLSVFRGVGPRSWSPSPRDVSGGVDGSPGVLRSSNQHYAVGASHRSGEYSYLDKVFEVSSQGSTRADLGFRCAMDAGEVQARMDAGEYNELR